SLIGSKILIDVSFAEQSLLILYLFYLSIVSQLGLFVFGAKCFHVLISQMIMIQNHSLIHISCRIIEILLECLPAIFYWLTACIALERAVTIVKGATMNKKLSIKMAKIVIIFLVIMISLSYIYDPFNRQLIEDPRLDGHVWCVLKFQIKWLETFNTIINMIHLIIPFFINFILTIVFLFTFTRQKSTFSTKKACKTLLKEQFIAYKYL
ncbi:unnamed protein product, partial [Didymodactylos carnosus]